MNTCRVFPEPPNPAELPSTDPSRRRGDLLGIECMVAINRALLEHHEKRGECKEIFEDFGNGTVRKKKGHVEASAREEGGHVAEFEATPEMRTAAEKRKVSRDGGEPLFPGQSVENGKSGEADGADSEGRVAEKTDNPADFIEMDATANEDEAASGARVLRVSQPLDEMPNGVLWAALVYVILVTFWLATTRRMTQARPRPRLTLEGFRGLENAVERAELGKAKY